MSMATAGSANRLKSEALAARQGSEVMTSSPMEIISKGSYEICCRYCYINTIKLTN